MSIADNAPSSPQTASLTGTGTVVKLSPTSLNFGSVKVGQNSAPQPVTLSNVGSPSLSITNIGITGATTCGATLGAGKSAPST